MLIEPRASRRPDDEGLERVLAVLAARASDGQLALQSAAGLVAAAVAALWRGYASLTLFALGMSVASHGLWGVVTRELSERSAAADRTKRVLTAIRLLLRVLGSMAAFAFLLSLLMLTLGTWIS